MKNSFESQINKLIKYIFDIGYFGTKLHPNRNHEGQYIEGEPFDYMIILPNYKACFDAKMTEGLKWQFKPKDIKQAENLKHCKNAGMDAFFLVYFSDYKRMVKYDVDLFLSVLAEGRKHLKITEGEEWDYKKCLEVGKMFERLTHRSQYGIAYTKIAVNESNMVDVGECYTGRIIDRLATYEDSGLSPEQVQELAKAKAEGRLMVLPCKAGDTIWKIKAVFSYFSKPMEDRVERIIITNSEILVYCTSGTKFSVNSIGKIVFLTREEAEKALEGLETRKQRGY